MICLLACSLAFEIFTEPQSLHSMGPFRTSKLVGRTPNQDLPVAFEGLELFEEVLLGGEEMERHWG